MAWSKNLDWSVFYSIPNGLRDCYLAKLGLEIEPPTKYYLDRLVMAHLCKIPFENLASTLWNESVSIEPQKIMEKLLYKNRGGYCFELNGLFHLLLRTLGFDAWMCPCRQLRHHEPFPVPATHCAIIVNLDGKQLFCDVGYGGPIPHGSIEWETERIQTVDSQSFYFKEQPSGWFSLIKKGKEDLPLLEAARLNCHLSDFYGPNLLRSTGDSAYSELHVSRLTSNGYVDLTGNRFVIKQGTLHQERIIKEKELDSVLCKYFGIER